MDMLRKFSVPCVEIDDFICHNVDCNFVGKHAKDLFTHYRLIHTSDSSISSGCLYSKVCTDKFTSFSGLRNHMYEFHREFLESDAYSSSKPSSSSSAQVNLANVGLIDVEPDGMPVDFSMGISPDDDLSKCIAVMYIPSE